MGLTGRVGLTETVLLVMWGGLLGGTVSSGEFTMVDDSPRDFAMFGVKGISFVAVFTRLSR